MFRNAPYPFLDRDRLARRRSRRARHERGMRGPNSPRVELLESRALLTVAGTWTALGSFAPGSIGTMELLSDGTVMASGAAGFASSNWFRLTPDATGSYAAGTWSSLASMGTARLYDATNVLQDGRVFVLGGEYTGSNTTTTWTNTGEIYDPVANTWAGIPNFPQSQFGDDPSMLLPDGRVLAGYLSGPATYIYDPATGNWSSGPTKLYSDRSDEETWIKLSDGSILSYDIFGNAQHAQRLDTSSMTWIDSGSVPVALQTSKAELGGGVLLPDGRVFLVGGTSNTALYTPATTPGGTGTWAAGPVIPGGLGGNDAPAAMLPNGHVLFAAGATPGFSGPTHLFEFDPTVPIASSLTDVTPTTPNLTGSPSFVTRMLILPSGQVLFTYGSSQLYIYTPSGSPQAAWKPTIASVVPSGSNYTLTGTQLNGLSAGVSYGDDAEMDSNYPIVELQDGVGGVYFARTFNWSSTGVATGSTSVSTSFSLPAGIPAGTYNLVVVANGIASNPVAFTVAVNGQSADLAVGFTGPSVTGNEGDNLTFNLSVTNNGPNDATGVVLKDTLGASLKYVSVTGGTVSQSGGVVTISIGTVASGQTVTATVTAQATEDGVLTDSATVTSSVSDPNASNNSASTTATVSEPAIVVSAPITTSSKKLNNSTVATFTHASGVEPTSAFSATINWGDGKTSQGNVTLSGGTYSVRGSHNYAGGGSHTITTTVTEVANPPGSKSATTTNSEDSTNVSSDQVVVVIVDNSNQDDSNDSGGDGNGDSQTANGNKKKNS